MGIVLSIIAFFIGIMVLGHSQIVEGRQKEKQKEILLSLNKDLADFDKMPSLTSTDLLTRVAVDYDKQRLYIWFAEDKKGEVLQKPYLGMPYRLLNFATKDLDAVAIVEDGYILSSHGNVDDIPKGAMGAISTDPNKKPVDKVTSLALLLKLDHAKHSLFNINFYNQPYLPLAKNSPEYEAFQREARKWYGRLEMAMGGRPKRSPEPLQPLQDKQTIIQTVEAPIETIQTPQKPESSESIERKMEKEQPATKPLVQEEAELSYFDRLVAENKRQLSERPTKEE